MNQATAPVPETQPARLAGHTCPGCGMPAPAVVAVLPSGRRALIEACAICGRQEVTPLDAGAPGQEPSVETGLRVAQGGH